MGNPTPLVSIILPVYGRNHLLERTLRSIVMQTYGNIEILLVDDGSPEPLKNISDGFNDKRIVYIRHAVNRGVAEARNTGLETARGEFIAFLDGDDEYLPEKTEKQVKAILGCGADEGIGAVYCGMLLEKDNRRHIYSPKVCRWNVLLQQTMAAREVIEKTGFFDTDFTYAGDTDYIYRLQKVTRLAHIPEPLVIFHSTPGSHSKNIEPLNKCTELFVRKHSGTLSRDEKSRWLYYTGNRYIHIKKFPEGYRAFFRAFIAYPLNERALRKLLRLFPLFLFHTLRKDSHDSKCR